ncbi:holin-associated N-acetylmuramidase [Hasllibacter sp. MH4015]|uniref:holin-associated N-acetylmuramidase n=1 Tax=Hasllibacter sp. MH4015 TaxID=2854029 RepID=UPI001CD5E2AC|nr:holin-associated N-acetylmuramidase [Hasllibacter sp. MH4015]
MQSVRSIAESIVAREGGFVNDPDDPGGATKHGVTIHTMRALGLDLDADGDVDVADVRRITPDIATDIFIDHYFTAPRIHLLPDPLQATVFDMQVNAGSNAVRILQRLLRDMGLDIAVDGVIGPQTARAAHAALLQAPDHLVDAYGIARRNYYYRIGDRRPASRKYARRRDGGKGGWIIRAEEFISPRYHLTLAQHRERTASWH